jgi:hypothetical protein
MPGFDCDHGENTWSSSSLAGNNTKAPMRAVILVYFTKPPQLHTLCNVGVFWSSEIILIFIYLICAVGCAVMCCSNVFGTVLSSTSRVNVCALLLLLIGRGDSLHWLRDTLYPLKLALTSPTSGGRSVGIVRWRTKPRSFFKRSYICRLDVHEWHNVNASFREYRARSSKSECGGALWTVGAVPAAVNECNWKIYPANIRFVSWQHTRDISGCIFFLNKDNLHHNWGSFYQ